MQSITQRITKYIKQNKENFKLYNKKMILRKTDKNLNVIVEQLKRRVEPFEGIHICVSRNQKFCRYICKGSELARFFRVLNFLNERGYNYFLKLVIISSKLLLLANISFWKEVKMIFRIAILRTLINLANISTMRKIREN